MSEAERNVVSFMNKPMQALSMDEQRRPVPAYTIEPMKRKTVVNRTVKDEIGFRVVPTDIEVDGYMVRTLRGDSVFVTHEDLVRMKLDKNLVPLLLEGGDDTPVGMQQVSAAAALSTKQKAALDAVTKLLETDPTLVERLLAEKTPEDNATEQEE
jgi:hypothetical protein